MESSEKTTPQVTFTNEPKLSGQEVDQTFNERRIELVDHIKNFVTNHELFQGTEIQITFATKGISSLVSTIEAHGEKVILKIPLSTTHSIGEAEFLKKWEEVGVKVPHIIETGVINGHQYTLMEHIDAQTISDANSEEELLANGTYLHMGQTLRLMHSATAEGFGLVVDGHAEFSNIAEWFDGTDMQKRVAYVLEHNLLGEEYGSFESIRDIIIKFVEAHPQSSYCHDDFEVYNIFATEPITVFDPNPRFNHGYIDLGRTLMRQVASGRSHKTFNQIMAGYFGDKVPDMKVLHATIVLACYMKFSYWNKTKDRRINQIENAQTYLKENSHFLD